MGTIENNKWNVINYQSTRHCKLTIFRNLSQCNMLMIKLFWKVSSSFMNILKRSICFTRLFSTQVFSVSQGPLNTFPSIFPLIFDQKSSNQSEITHLLPIDLAYSMLFELFVDCNVELLVDIVVCFVLFSNKFYIALPCLTQFQKFQMKFSDRRSQRHTQNSCHYHHT